MYFFANPTALRPQLPAQAYGPVVGEASTSYRVTSKFHVTGDTAAIAAFAGVVLVQPHTQYPADLCNLAIRVSDINDSRAQFDRVAYVIYRGLRRSSFYTAATPPAVAPLTPTTNSDLLQTVWAAYTLEKAKNFLADDPTTNWLGFQYDTAAASLPLDDGFSDTTHNTHLTHIKAGQSLGLFADKVGGVDVEAGIEFVLVDRFYQPTFGDLRAAEMVFKVTASTGPAGHEANYAVQRYRENILNYIDPAAYYTMHYRGGVSFYPGSGPVRTLLDAGDITQTLLGAFGPSRNRIYIDIRNDLGGSLNFYRDNEGTGLEQGTHFKVGFTEADQKFTNYYTDNWPIFCVVANSPEANAGNLYLSFLQAYNPQPLLFADYCYGYNTTKGTVPLTTENRFSDLTNTGQSWSRALQLKMVPPALTSGHPVWFVKLMCIRQQMPANVPINGPVPIRNHPFDHVFFPLSAALTNPAAPTGTTTLLPGKRYVAGTGTDIGTMVEVSVMLTKNLAVFRAQPLLTPEPPVLVVPHTYSDADEQPWRLPGITTRKSDYQDSDSKTISFIKQTVADTGVRAPNQDVLALTVLRSQVANELIPASKAFDRTLDEVRLVLDNLLRTQATLSAVLGAEQQHYLLADLKISGLTNTGKYDSSNPYSSIVHTYSLDNKIFNTDQSLQGLSLDLTPNSNGYFSANDLIKYVKVVEEAFGNKELLGDWADSTALHTATRIRVHSYGRYADSENVSPTKFRLTTKSVKQWFVDNRLAEGVKGEAFDASIPKARYSAPNKMNLLPNPYNHGKEEPLREYVRLAPEVLSKVAGGKEAYHHLVAAADENGIGANPSPYVRVINTASPIPIHNIDLGHLLYGFEAWQLGQNATGPGYKAEPIGIFDASDLAGFIADVITPAPEFFYRLQQAPESTFDSPAYPLAGTSNELRRFYDVSAPEADLYGDADAIGLDNAYRSLAVQSGTPTSVKLSDVLTAYYSPEPGNTRVGLVCKRNPLGYHYSRRWFNVARRFNFILPFSDYRKYFSYSDDKIFDEREFVWIGDVLSPSLAATFGASFQGPREEFRKKSEVFARFWYYTLTSWKAGIANRITFNSNMLISYTNVYDEIPKGVEIKQLIDQVVNQFFLPDLKASIQAENPSIVFKK
jgi:hypothetical protein